LKLLVFVDVIIHFNEVDVGWESGEGSFSNNDAFEGSGGITPKTTSRWSITQLVGTLIVSPDKGEDEEVR
jgi:hypothetical protein